MHKYFLLVLVVFLTACGSGKGQRIGPLTWEGAVVEVETRPSPPTSGMVEFIVIASRKKSQPVNDLIVSLRASDRQEWKQAIQDGYTGVYRRAIMVNDVASDVLQARLQQKDKVTILNFPLKDSLVSE
jgi:hypothetical protein